MGNKEMRWRSAKEEWPTKEMTMENSEFIVVIKGATNPTTLLYDEDYGVWSDEEGNVYPVDWWMPLPEMPEVTK